MELDGKHGASLNDWKSLGSLTLLKPPHSFPPLLPSFCLSLCFSFPFHSLSATAASGRGCQAALMPQEEESWFLPSNPTWTPRDTRASSRNKRQGGGMELRWQEPEGHPSAAGIFKSFEVLGWFFVWFYFFSHQYLQKDATPPTLPGIHLTHI